MAQVSFTSARSGSGKTYRRAAHFLCTEWLPNPLRGTHFSNFPLHIDKLVDYVMERNPTMDRESLKSRIHVIPEDEIKRWRLEPGPECGPWAYFRNLDLRNSHIAIDEIHNFVSSKGTKQEIIALWREWIGELRHRGVIECEFLSQYETKVATVIRHESGLRRYLFNKSEIRDPWTGAVNDDIYNLIAGLTDGQYEATVVEIVTQEVAGKWKELPGARKAFKICAPFYYFYDSYSAPVAGGFKADGAQHMYLLFKGNRWGLIKWFWWRNWSNLSIRVVGLIAFIWFMSGGYKVFFNVFFSLFSSFMPAGAMPADGAPPAEVRQEENQEKPRIEKRESYTYEEMSLAIAELEKLEKEIERLAPFEEKAKEREEKEFKGFLLTMIQGKNAVFRNGATFSVGDVIEEGPYKGRRIMEVNPVKRYIRIGDEKVWLGR